MKTIDFLILLLIIISSSCHKKNMIDLLNEPSGTVYDQWSDSLKIQSFDFLVKNIGNSGSEKHKIFLNDCQISYAEVLQKYNDPAFSDDISGILYQTEFHLDKDSLSTDYLKQNIDQAYSTWSNSNWSKEISFDMYLSFILPYRIGDEPLENWRKMVFDEFKDYSDSINMSNLFDGCNIISRKIRNEFQYKNEGLISEWGASFSELNYIKQGTCTAFSKYNAYVMRAYGIPVMVDFIPFWSNCNGGHCWNSIYIHDTLYGIFWEAGLYDKRFLFSYDFDLLQEKEKLRRTGKIYRHTYEIQKNSLAEKCENIREIPSFFQNNKILDVTTEYIRTHDILIEPKNLDNGLEKYGYLCVYNFGKWEAIAWGELEDSKYFRFNDVGGNSIYLISTYKNGRYNYISLPFEVTDTGSIRYLNNKSKVISKLKVTRCDFNPSFIDEDHFITSGKRYSIQMWENNEWKTLESKTAITDQIYFNNIPLDTLLRIYIENSKSHGRVFLIKGKDMIWY